MLPRPLARALRLSRREWPLLAFGTLASAVAAAGSLLFVQAIRVVLDAIAGEGATTILGLAGPRLAYAAAGVLVLLAFVEGVAVVARQLLFTLAGDRVVARLRSTLFRRLLAQEIGFFDGLRTGELTSRLATDTEVLRGLVSSSLAQTVRNAAVAFGGMAFLVWTSPRLAALMLAVVPPVAFGSAVCGSRIRRFSREAQDAFAAAAAVAEEGLSGIRTVRAFDAEAREAARYSAEIDRGLTIARRRARAGALLVGAVSAGAYVAMAAVIGYGGWLVLHGALTVGALTSFIIYTVLVAFALNILAELWGEFLRAAGAAERAFDLLDRVPAMDSNGCLAPGSVEGSVSFDGVEFAYPTRPDVPVIRGLRLAIAPGEVLALVGPSGGGKSTIAALTIRLYDPQAGTIRLDGCDVRALDARWLRRQIGVVSQEPILFSATIAENIRYGRPDAPDADVEAAARAANAHEFIMRFSAGYDTQVGERGIQLSGGQKQRVAIARAVLKDPRILILDEATSALDSESEALVRDALERLMRGRTVLVIAHRLSTVQGADRVAVIDAGRVVQLGPHARLLAEEGPYRRLVDRQILAA